MMLPYCLFVIMDMEFFLHLDNKKYKMFVFPLNILQFRLFNETHCLPIILSYFLSYFLKSMSSRGKSLWSDLPSHHTPIESGMFIVCILRRSAAPNTKVTQVFLCWQAGGRLGLGISKTLIRLLCLPCLSIKPDGYLQLLSEPSKLYISNIRAPAPQLAHS